MHKFDESTKWLFQCLCFESECICPQCCYSPVSQSVSPAACCCWEGACGFQSWIQLTVGAPWAGGVLHNFACLMKSAASTSCLDTPSSSEQRQSRLLHDSSVTRLCFYLGMVSDWEPCTLNTKHQLLMFVFSFKFAL